MKHVSLSRACVAPSHLALAEAVADEFLAADGEWTRQKLAARIAQVMTVAVRRAEDAVRAEYEPRNCNECGEEIPDTVDDGHRFCSQACQIRFDAGMRIDLAHDREKDRRAGLLSFALCACSGAVMYALTMGVL